MPTGRTGDGARRWGGRTAAARRRAWMAGAVLAVLGCARQSAPPGGPPDARPPVVVRTVPEGLASVPDFEGPVRFEFDERISEQAGGSTLDAAVTVSPWTGEVRVSHGRQSLEVEMDGGFRRGVVYRVTLQPVVRDMFGNTLRDPFELVFDTGAEPDETAVAGEIWDRVTGRGVADASVQAVGSDSLVHVASSGEGGIYALRYVPSGRYTLTAFQDQDGDGVPDLMETQGTTDFELSAGDTIFMDVPMIPADTTPPVLLAAEVLDSMTVAVRFDDYLDPAVDLGAAEFGVRSSAGTPVGVTRRYHAADWIRHVNQVRDSLARADSIARADSVAAAPPGAPPAQQPADSLVLPDSLEPPAGAPDSAVVADSTAAGMAQAAPPRRGPPPLPGGGIQGLEAARARGRILPGRRVVLVLEAPLVPDETYVVETSGIVNLNGLASEPAEVEAEPLTATGAGGGG